MRKNQRRAVSAAGSRPYFNLCVALCVLLLAGFAAARAETGSAEAATDTSAALAAATRSVVVYYLYFTPRCETCINMEIYAKEAVETGFARELAQGTVVWHSYDTGLDEYKHYWDDFQLETKALIMVELQNGTPVRWKNCEEIWDFANVKPTFLKYVQAEVQAYLAPPKP